MRIPSRLMPPSPSERDSLPDWLFLCPLLAVMALPGLLWWPLAFVMPGVILVGNLEHRRRDARLAARRAHLSICDFARSFPRREVDTWILRAVYEELESGGRFPVRASDRINFLGIAGDDLDDLFFDLAARTGRSTEDTELNPMFGRVESVRHLVQCLNHQPLIAPRSQSA